jgi:flagellar capping protein FliD
MASTVSSIDVSLKNLAPTFQTAIRAIIESESAPLQRTQSLRDQLDVRRGVYSDVRTNFDALQSAIQSLISAQASYGLKLVSKSSVTPLAAGTTVLSASITNDATPPVDYDISVMRLAKAESRATAPAASADTPLNRSGTFWLGGTGQAALQTEISPSSYSDFVPSGIVTAAAVNSVASGRQELGQGNYTVQARDFNGTRQFRLVDADGNAVSIHSTNGTSGYTSDWQSVIDGAYDTGRGQMLTFSRDGSLDSTTFHYAAKGVSVFITASDTPRTIAKAINAVTQPDGHDFKALVVANQLVLTSVQTGKNHGMVFTDGAGLCFSTLLQEARNAEFTINEMDVSTAGNTGLANLVNGATIDLAADAEGKSARLTINANAEKATGLVSMMVSKFNTSITHLKDKLSSTAKADGDKTTYTRGPLAGDTTFSSLRTDLLYRMNRSYVNRGSYKRLDEIGIRVDDDLKLTLDSDKFSDALKNHSADTTALLDAAMGGINELLSHYTGSNGYLSQSLTSIDNQRNSYDQRIAKYNDRLNLRKQALYNQYLEYQNQLADLGRTAQMFGINLGSNVNTSS